MFFSCNNLGMKLKNIATVLFTIGCILSGIVFVVLILSGGLSNIITLLASLLVLALGITVSWLANLCLFGIGQAVENTELLLNNLCNQNDMFDENQDINVPSEEEYNNLFKN